MKFKEFVTLNEYVEKRGDEWVVLNHAKTKVLGTHKTKEEAVDQLQAIEIAKHKG